MDGKGRADGVLAVSCADPIMSVLGPIGMAAAAGTALIVDLGTGWRHPRARTLADVAADGARLVELAPGRRGVAIVSSGSLPAEPASEMISRLARHWPALVVRPGAEGWDGATVPLIPLFPGWLAPEHAGSAVWQQIPGGSRPIGPGPVLPPLGRASIRRMLGGGLPAGRRWVRAWRQVWELPWA